MFFPHGFWSNSRMPMQNLIAYYKLNNNGNDSHGTNHLSSNGSISYSTGKIGDALRTTDKGNYLYHASNSNFQLNTNKTFAFWFQSNDTPTEFLLSKYDDGGNEEYHFSKIVTTNPFSIDFTVYTPNVYTASASNIYLNTWNLCIGWTDIDNLLIWIQLNNESPISSSVLDVAPSVENANFMVGGTSAAGPEGSNNTVDEISIWNRILTTSERNTLWNNGNGRTYPFS